MHSIPLQTVKKRSRMAFIRTSLLPSLPSQFRPTISPQTPAFQVSMRAPTTRSVTSAYAYPTRDPNGFTVISVDGMSRRPTPFWLIGLILSALIWLWRRFIILRHLSRVYKRANLKRDIADFYDIRSAAWETVWGEHMHHGLYDVVSNSRLKGRDAQVRTMSELLRLGGLLNTSLPDGARVLDVGCGIGGASRFLARHFGPSCQVTGITLSPYQANRATELNNQMGLSHRVKNIVCDAMDTGFPDNHFDVVWSLESGEHMENKQLFLQECARVLKPGGTLVMLAWCIRETNPPLRVAERFSIRRIMEEYCLPRVAPPSEYGTEITRSGLRKLHIEDWTIRAAPFWGEVVRSAAFNPKGWSVLRKYGWPLVRSAIAMRHVIAGIRQGVFRLVAFTGKKSTPVEWQEETDNAIQCRSKTALPLET